MSTMWSVQADTRNQGYDLPDCVGKTSFQCHYTTDQNSYLPHGVW